MLARMFLGALAACASSLACTPASAPDAPRLASYTHVMGRREVWIVAPPGPLAERGRALAAELNRRTGFRGECLAPDDPAPDRGLRVVLGTLDDPEVAAAAERAGVVPLAGGGFRVLGYEHGSPTDTFVLSRCSTGDGGPPLVVFGGTDPVAVARRAREIPAPWSPALATWMGSGRGLELELTPDGRPRPRTLLARGPAREARWRRARAWPAGAVVLHAPAGEGTDRATLRSYRTRCEFAVRRVQRWLGAELAEPIEVLVYAHASDLEREVGRASLGEVDHATLRVHALLADGVPDDGGAAVARAAALALAGEPAEPWLFEAIGVAAAGTWWGRDLSDWLTHVTGTGLVPRIEVVTGQRSLDGLSDHVILPLRALALKRGNRDGALVRAWRGEAPLPLRRFSLKWEGDEEGAEVVPREAAGDEAEAGEEYGSPLRRPWPAGERGVALYGRAPRGLASAYASRSVDEALASARRLGADAFSLTVQAAMRAFDPLVLPAREAPLHGRAPDVALASALASGRRLGLSAMLVLEPLAAPWSTWGDGARFASDEDMRDFFREFRRMAEHYALLGELLGLERICLGSGLTRASNTVIHRGEPPWVMRSKTKRRKSWVGLIHSVRRAYSGALTYAARTPDEVERVVFWPQLDAVGMLGFRPFAPEGTEPSRLRVRNVLREQLGLARDLAARHEAGFVFVQLGFPARADSWPDPIVPRGAVSPEAQAGFYRELARVLAEAGPDASDVGLYLWTWSPDPSEPYANDYSPRVRDGASHLGAVLGG